MALGPAVRIAPNEVSLSSPTAAKEVFTAGRGFYKTDFYGVFPPISSPDIFTEVREDIHAAKKRFAASPYSMASMSQMTKFIENTEVALTTQLDSFSRSGTVCDLGDYLHFFAFDVGLVNEENFLVSPTYTTFSIRCLVKWHFRGSLDSSTQGMTWKMR